MLANDEAPSLGRTDAPITLVEFGDFECPYCRQMSGSIKQILAESDDIRFIYRNFPLRVHPWAAAAARIGDCVSTQNGDAYWKLYDFLFASQAILSEDNIQAKVTSFLSLLPAGKVDLARAAACFRSQQAEEDVQRDIRLGIVCGVNGTPTLFVNGRGYPGIKTASQLESLLQSARETNSKEAKPLSKASTTSAKPAN